MRPIRTSSGRAILAVVALLSTMALLAGGSVRAADDDAEMPVKRIKMDAENWKWSPNQIRVQEGTKVILQIRSFDATHRFDMKDFGLKVVLPQDKTTTVEFIAEKPGKYKWKCGRPCGDGCPRMRGTLTITEKADDDPEADG